MIEKNLFLFQPHEKHEQHTVLNTGMDGVDRQLLTRLESEGKGVEVSFGPYDEYRRKAQQLESNYLKAEKRIKSSDNPLHTPEYKEYELKKAWDEYEAETKALQAEWTEARAQMVSDAKAKAARATIPVSQSDKTTAEQIADRFALGIAGVQNAAQISEIVAQAAEDIAYLSDAEKTALQSKLPGILAQVEAKADKYGVKVSTSGLVGAVKDIRNMDLLGAKVAEWLPETITDEIDTKNIVKNARNGRRPSTVRGVARV